MITQEQKVTLRLIINSMFQQSNFQDLPSILGYIAGLTDEEVTALITKYENNQAINSQIEQLQGQIEPISMPRLDGLGG